jgi:glycosyltransferase involved in cell wall biosynthesis
LEHAIRSVLAQTYRKFEYIICDNHSTDNSADVAQRYAAMDSRIKLIRPPEFLAQAKNFNFALQHISADSRYCKLIFGDDLLLPNCLREMVALAEANPSVAIVSSYRLIETTGDGFGLPLEQTKIPGRVAGRLHLLKGIFLFGTPSTVLYTSDVVRARSPRFYPEDRFYFDTDAVFQILADRDFGFVHQVLTFSRYQPGSITRREAEYYSRAIDRIICLHSYGHTYLTAEEYDRATSYARRVYYEGLGRQWLKDRLGAELGDFWPYHEKRLSTVGLEVEKARLALGVGDALVRAVASPFELARNVVRRRRPVEDPWKV